jgi:hypothetical protein
MKARDVATVILCGSILAAIFVMWVAGVESCTNALIPVC